MAASTSDLPKYTKTVQGETAKIRSPFRSAALNPYPGKRTPLRFPHLAKLVDDERYQRPDSGRGWNENPVIPTPAPSMRRNRRKSAHPARAPEAADTSCMLDLGRLQALPRKIQPFHFPADQKPRHVKGNRATAKPKAKVSRPTAPAAQTGALMSAPRMSAPCTAERPLHQAQPSALMGVGRRHAPPPLMAGQAIPLPAANGPMGPQVEAAAAAAVKECSECKTRHTPMWRREEGALMCNACGLRRKRAAAAAQGRPRSDRNKRRRTEAQEAEAPMLQVQLQRLPAQPVGLPDAPPLVLQGPHPTMHLYDRFPLSSLLQKLPPRWTNGATRPVQQPMHATAPFAGSRGQKRLRGDMDESPLEEEV